MFTKEQGWVLAIDQASNQAGVSLWYNGKLFKTTVLTSMSPNDPMPLRLQNQVHQLTEFLDLNVPDTDRIGTVIFEGVRARLVQLTVGAFLICNQLAYCKIHRDRSFVESSTWKGWAKRKGATGTFKYIKGMKALEESGFPLHQYEPMSDDVADSIMIYQSWRELTG